MAKTNFVKLGISGVGAVANKLRESDLNLTAALEVGEI